jgi:hypothetical protein
VPEPLAASYPIRLKVQREERQSRLTNFPFLVGTLIRELLLIPHFAILVLLGIAAGVLHFIATFAILFTGRYPAGLFRFVAGTTRWSHNVTGYLYHLYDAYPPFSMDPQPYALGFEVDYPERSSRLLNFPFFGLYIKAFLLIPHFAALFCLTLVMLVVLFVAPFAILFTGGFPAGMHGFATGVLRWSARVNAYLLALTDRYPPFSLA